MTFDEVNNKHFKALHKGHTIGYTFGNDGRNENRKDQA